MAATLRPDPFLRDRSHPVKPTPLGAIVILLVLIALSLAALVPLYWMFATSLTPSAMTVKFPPELVPSNPTLDNYRAVLRQPNFWSWVKNSVGNRFRSTSRFAFWLSRPMEAVATD